MKRILTGLFCCLTVSSLAFGQLATPQGYTIAIPLQPGPTDGSIQPVISNSPLPRWNYTATASAALGGGTFSGTIVGRSPYNRGKGTTTIPTQIIPLIITINDGTTTVTYDPTAVDPCVAGGLTDVQVITGSPIFTNNAWTMNGINVGNTQYIDAYQRAQFWSLVGGSPYHVILQQSTLAAQSLSFTGAGSGTNYAATTFNPNGCGNVGVVNINTLDAAVKALITGNGPLVGTVNTGTFPIFLTKNVVSATSGVSIFANCCVLGYHSAFGTVANPQIYSPFSLDTSGVFGGDVSTLSHEMGEAIDDPLGNNATPPWGHLGQVQNACQANLENGDPLSPGFPPPVSNSFVVAGGNGQTYHMQELVFYSWYFGGPSLGTGGKYSNNGTFGGEAKPCPPGGTN